MEEKKLTDKELVKVLDECFAKCGKMSCYECKLFDNTGLRLCMRNVAVETLNLIHRLQAENERLTEEKQSLIGRKAGLYYSYNQVKEKNAELQKQVDELKEENGKLVTIGNGFALERNNLREELDELKKSGNGVLLTSLYKKQADDHKRGLSVQRAYWEKQVQQAVKDTAKEALEAFICKLVNIRLVSTKEDLYVEMLETKDDLLKECYGVEVE